LSASPHPVADAAKAPPAAPQLSSDVHTAFRNGLKLAVSLVATWSVALIARFFLPRVLGPERFGMLNFADSVAAAYFMFLSMGIDTYVQKEVSTRPEHTSDFLGGATALRAALGGLVLGGLALSLQAAGRPPELRQLALIFGCAQILVATNTTLGALLQANTRVGGLAIANVASKLVWGSLLAASLVVKAPLTAFAAAFLVSEVLRALVLYPLAQRSLGFALRVDVAATARVLKASLPYYVNGMALALAGRLDVTMLGFLTRDDKQVGWYSAASNVAGLSMLLSPALGWVLMPLLARAKSRSDEEFWTILSRSIEGIQTIAIPLTLFLSLGAELWVRLIFGEAYAPAALSLRALAPQFVFTYLAVLLAIALIILGRGWTLTAVSLVGLAVNPLLIVLALPLTARWFGMGGAGVGAASGVVGMEIVVTSLFLHRIGGSAIDARCRRAIVRTAAAVVAVVLLHVLLRPLGDVRLVADAVAYVLLVTASGAVRPAEVVQVIQLLRQRRAESSAA
jgi:O-antigen/teichoic acid export membrane protein